MPFDNYFKSKPKAAPKLNRYGKPAESIEMQIGRSDYALHIPRSACPFPSNGSDAQQWREGWDAQKRLA